MLASCSRLAAEESELDFFERKIRPLLLSHCIDCHGEAKQQGGLRLDSRDGWQLGGDSGPAIVVGAPEKSLLIRAVRYEDTELRMPPRSRLSESEIGELVRWIERGAVDPREAIDTSRPSSPSALSVDDGRRFWAFQPLANITVPEFPKHSWIQSPVDAFVREQWSIHGLQPAGKADRRALIKRVTQDLIGLPPTLEEVESFVVDESVDAYERLVDRLLASPQYGVRWGRHWLDVVRYADSNGLDENLAFGTAWRYRDYVIDAFNRDKPYSSFVQEQLAGDLIASPTRETKTATGFLVLGAKVLAEPDREKLLMDTIDEQIDTIGKAMLGLTLGCARCHDHKFDPILQRDYYGLAAILKSTKTFGDTNYGAIKHWNETVFASESEKERIRKIDQEIAAKQQRAAEYRSQAMQRIRQEARDRAAEYLIAAAQLSPDATLVEAEQVAIPLKLHPRILFHCRRHLEFHRDDALFARWHEAYESKDHQGLSSYYEMLFADVSNSWKSTLERDPSATRLDDAELESVRLAIHDASGFLAVPAKPEHAFDADTLAEYHRLMEESRLFESFAPDLDSALGVCDGVVFVSTPILIRGNHNQFGADISRSVPEVLTSLAPPPTFSRKESGRLELAQWLTQQAHALTARVFVNRVWRWHFGRGLVETTDNFGVLGNTPSHPELLDWLARYFVESGWSVKDLHRVILLSSTYQMDSRSEGDSRELDPENRWLSRFSVQRLDAEQIRDAILFVSGELDLQLGGKSVPLRNRQFVFDHTSIDHTKYDSRRRAAFLPIIRNHLYDHFEQFDFPDPTAVSGNRTTTTIAPQALILMNSDWVVESAEKLAARIESQGTPQEAQIRCTYEMILSRSPRASELQRVLAFLHGPEDSVRRLGFAVSTSHRADNVSRLALLCQVLMTGNEFLFCE